jgi:hypothetical protein
MRKLLFILSLLFLIFFSNSILGQSKIVFSKKSKSGKIRCASTEYENYLRQNNINRANTIEFEKWITPKIDKLKSQAHYQKSTEIITIPVVIHIIHNGDPVNQNENISDEQAMSQITVLNQDFRKMMGTRGYNTSPIGADVGVEFCLAKRKPNGTATNGIDRINKSASSYRTLSVTEKMKTETQWDPNQYLNIWTVKFSDNESDEMSGTLGYAQFPSTSNLPGLEYDEGEANTDGVVIDYRYFGTSDITPEPSDPDYDKGRTTTHEVGHYLGLLHIWGDGEGDSELGIADCTATDYCNDTPQTGYEHYECGTYDTCPSKSGKDMPENYMDYTNDVCMNIFTINQKDRILAVMDNSIRRESLKTSNACKEVLDTEDFNFLNEIKLYPNPVDNVLNISFSLNVIPDELIVYNSLGQVIDHVKVISTIETTINTNFYSKGVYLIKFVKENKFKTYQFIKD